MKIVIYQVLPRLFGNKGRKASHRAKGNTQNGTIEENGVGKFSMFTPKVLKGLKDFGYTHVWYTGVLDHATQTDYSAIGQPANHRAVVKGKAGSPYAVRDYYNVDADLADKPEERMQEWEKLIARTHKAGLKVIMDFIPNHVARNYNSISAPEGVESLGAGDREDWHFWRDNNFYYCVNESFSPQFDREDYVEFPARATGNDCFSASPGVNDWYETVKLNYGVDYCGGGATHFNPHPDTWHKMLQILLFWASKGVDGFRCDMAEMVPVEFWHWAIAKVKKEYPDVAFIAEVYNPAQYRSYIHHGGFDYLYDKVGLYDTLRSVVQGQGTAEAITYAWQAVDDIKDHMLNFMENHDEQRIASQFFAGDAEKGFPAMAVSTLMNTSPIMVYAGQELGENAHEAEGFSGFDGRTTIFDYWKVESLCSLPKIYGKEQCTMHNAQCTIFELYRRLLSIANSEVVADGRFYDLMWLNQRNPQFDSFRQYAFVRYTDKEVLFVVANFAGEERNVRINLTHHLFDAMNNFEQSEKLSTLNSQLSTKSGKVIARDLMTDIETELNFSAEEPVEVVLKPYQVCAYLIKRQ